LKYPTERVKWAFFKAFARSVFKIRLVQFRFFEVGFLSVQFSFWSVGQFLNFGSWLARFGLFLFGHFGKLNTGCFSGFFSVLFFFFLWLISAGSIQVFGPCFCGFLPVPQAGVPPLKSA
jgi:hypothetical protein